MPEDERTQQVLGLADFLTDLRAELAEAARRADSDPLKLELDEVTVTLQVGVTLAHKGEVSGKASAKFWVFASAEAGVRGERSLQDVTTQQLTLSLKPHLEQVVVDVAGRAATVRTNVDVSGTLTADEERPDMPPPRRP